MGAPARLTAVGPGAVRLARIAAGVFVVGMAGFVVLPAAQVLAAPTRGAQAPVALLACVTCCYLHLVVRALRDRRSGVDLAVLSALAGLSAAGPFVVGPSWSGIGFMLPLACAVTLRGRWAAIAFTAALLLGAVLSTVAGAPWVIYSTVQSGLTAGALAGLMLFGALLQELHHTRGELARLAVTEERLRFARELHDVLGHNLSVIAMKTELSMRIPATQSQRLLGELADVHGIARRSLHDVRAVVKGYREMSLDRELSGVRRVLETAGIRCTFADVPASLPPAVRVALAWAVREAATNVLRHSDATACVLTVEQDDERVRISLANDGVRSGGRTDPMGGSGLAGVDERLAQVGGACERLIMDDGWFRLTLDVPRELPAVASISSGGEP
ncbi:sensor histidine kinase [Microtetraspora malaysiensis]|uniref:Sensor histidine kinase n=1 Tax=Microtetraspora malaysiensis TaxID=161358 RepID=A0ABW6SIR0_9ACTN